MKEEAKGEERMTREDWTSKALEKETDGRRTGETVSWDGAEEGGAGTYGSDWTEGGEGEGERKNTRRGVGGGEWRRDEWTDR